MLKRLRRWLGWDADPGVFGYGSADLTDHKGRPTSATGGLFAKQPATASALVKQQPAKAAPAATPARGGGRPAGQPQGVAAPPQLSLGKPAAPEDGFDPYNTGAFNRSQSWEKIGRRGR